MINGFIPPKSDQCLAPGCNRDEKVDRSKAYPSMAKPFWTPAPGQTDLGVPKRISLYLVGGHYSCVSMPNESPR